MTMKNSKAYRRPQVFLVIPLIVLLSQICAIAADTDNIDKAIYIKGEYLIDALHKLKVIDKIKGDELTPYEYKGYYKYDLETMKLSKIDKRKYPNNKADASPDREWAVEYIETRRDDNSMDTKFLLYSVDNPAKKIELAKTKRYAWSPQGDRITYLICKLNCPTFNDCPYQYTCDAWIYNMKADAKKKLDVKAYDVSWPSFDNNIYFNLAQVWDDPKIVRYHLNSGKIDETPYQGLIFSPSGKYYMKDHYDTEPFYLYQREPHKELIEIEKQLDNQLDKGISRYDTPLWLADGHSLLLKYRFVYDLDKMAFTKTMQVQGGAYLGMNRSRTYALFMMGVDQFKVIDLLSP